ncbi:M10 family metallopeptidase C-terminal domain-containing protein [Phaeobacter marinintestinus]|uniref:M10 family metallopeptidase C-terminal domain-containing protein n=1 Tax=Falsiphaeobacter marinintestinus TaxID=1492905 RepID=UPI0011B4E8DC|nr:hypothetical protein [Phaeobacter marinintestinus]
MPIHISSGSNQQTANDLTIVTEPVEDPGVFALSIPGDSSTTETIADGETRSETLETTTDTDWFRIELNAGDQIRIEVTGVDHDAGNGLDALVNPYAVFWNPIDGSLFHQGDEGSLKAGLPVTVSTSGTYFIEVGSAILGGTPYAGDYELEVFLVPPPAVPPPGPLEAIQGEHRWRTNDPLLIYFLPEDLLVGGFTTYETAVDQQARIWDLIEGVETFLDIEFQITTDRAQADIEIGITDLDGNTTGSAQLPPDPAWPSTKYLLLDYYYVGSSVIGPNGPAIGSLKAGEFGTANVLHELGHILGLGHTHDSSGETTNLQGVTSFSDTGDFGLNSHAYTVMSYNTPSAFGAGITGHSLGYAALDIAALQNLYGANTTHAAGDDIYDLDDTNATDSGAGYMAIWDTGGTDMIRYTGTKDATIDLRAATLQYENGGGGFLSYVDGVNAGRTIANGVIIENGTSGSGNDWIYGNFRDNFLNGNEGEDTLLGLAGNDSLRGGPGGDVLNGGAGVDFVLYDDSGVGVTVDLTEDGGGFQSASGGTADGDVISGFENVYGSDHADDLTGNTGANQLIGGAGADTLRGGDGDDLLRGDAGADVLEGGNDSDWVLYYGSSAGVTVDLTEVGGFQSASGGDAQGDVISGFEHVWGSDHADDLTGNADDNYLLGRDGDDDLDGGAGDDTMRGGLGGDTLEGGDDTDLIAYNTSTAGVTVNLTEVAGVQSASGGTADGDVISGFENVAGSDHADVLTGNDGANVMLGLDGADTMDGGGGDDILRGGAGADTMEGGTGNDWVQYAGSASGITVDLTEVAGFQSAIGGDADGDVISGFEHVFGSDHGDDLTGNDTGNVLIGGDGDDMINGGLGTDYLRGDAGADGFMFNTDLADNIDTIADFSVGEDTIHLNNAIFSGLEVGALAASAFTANLTGEAETSDTRIIYQTDTGNLYYDTDGLGGAAAVQFATLTGTPALTQDDFVVVELMIDIARLADDPYESIYGLRDDTSSRGVDLAGALITATYVDGSSESLTWQALDPYTNGGVTGADFSMFFGYQSHELTTSKLLTSLQIDLAPSGSVFDSTVVDETDGDYAGGSTPGSKFGFSFEVSPEYDVLAGTVTATYSGIVNLVGSPADGDLYTTMIIDFSGLSGGGFRGDLSWNSDIDTMEYLGDLMPAGTDAALAGEDILTGTAEADFLNGSTGDDILIGLAGNDVLNGGADADEFVLADGSGHDVIIDFDVSSGDFLNISAFGFDDLTAVLTASTDIGPDMVIALDADDSVTLIGINQADLLIDDFLLHPAI